MSQFNPPPYAPPSHKGKMTRRNKAVLAVVAGISVILVLIVVAAIAGAPGARTGTHPAAAAGPHHHAKASPAAHGVAPRPRLVTLATFSGSGDDNTAKFAVSGTWKLKWRYDCSAFGQAGNFAVLEDGGADAALTLNQLGKGARGQTYAYSDSGRHYLEINSECKWTVKVEGTK